jgi:NitT/TauT family transport system substrate-binding protein
MPTRRQIVAGLAATGASAWLPRSARAQATPLRVAGVYSDLFAEPFYAKEAGVFAKSGFEVDSTVLVNAGAVAAALGGSLDMGTGDLVSGVNAILAGVPILLVAGSGLYNEATDSSATVLGVAVDSPIRTPKDVIGKSVGVPTLVGMTTACVKSWLTTHGVDESSVRFVEIPPPIAVGALGRGAIDVALVSEPFVTAQKGQFRMLGSPYDVAADRAPNKTFCVSVWYAAKSWIEQDAARARRAVQAIYDTARWANAHHDDTFAILVRDGKLDPNAAHGMHRTTYATSLTPALVQPILDIALQNKIFPHPVDAASIIAKI